MKPFTLLLTCLMMAFDSNQSEAPHWENLECEVRTSLALTLNFTFLAKNTIDTSFRKEANICSLTLSLTGQRLLLSVSSTEDG